ncbi:hypothetical protein [uncultured Treponema sp.]|uniref:hypothetical protein n=1 Tax=uncultured Treponema sp. TaxID=162155 RepID=UPI0028EDDFC9|nr:hypothetical protein [uncultured Treponema sp.]
MGTKKQMTKDDTGFLWQNLVRYKRAKERGHKSAERFLDETYENFGFFGTLLHKMQSGLAAHILFDDENAFLRFCGSSIALLRKDWQDGMTWEEQHTAVTVEENPQFVHVLDLADISTFSLTEKEKNDIKTFIRLNWRLIRQLGTADNPESSDFIDAFDFSLRRFVQSPEKMKIRGISVFAKPDDGLPFSLFTGIKDIGGNLREFHKGNFEIPHAYIYSADGSLASRFRIDSQDIPKKLSTLYKTDMPLGKYEAQIIAWAKKSPARMIEENCHTNWDSMRAAWQNSFEEMYS